MSTKNTAYKHTSFDLKSILQHIDAMLGQVDCNFNTVSGQLMAVATAVECITLSVKLQRTLDRWAVYLPFHESSDVDVRWWLDHLTSIHRKLNSVENRPDAIFLIDYVDLLSAAAETAELTEDKIQADNDEPVPFYAPRYSDENMETDVSEYVERNDEHIDLIKSLSTEEKQELDTRIDREAMRVIGQQYTDYLRFIYTSRNDYSPKDFQESILPKAQGYLKAIIPQPIMGHCLDMALNTLLDNLRQIDDLFSSDLTEQQLLRLSLRLYYRHCFDSESKAQREVDHWIQEWPARSRKDYAHKRRDQIITNLQQRFSEPPLNKYIDLERPAPLTDPEFGRFLFAIRSLPSIGIEEVCDLFTDCFRIRRLNQIIDPDGTAAEVSSERLTASRKLIYGRFVELIRQADWIGGMTTERVQHCFAKLLLTQPTTPDIDRTRELLWDMLTSRRNCTDSFRSLKLTWLNLVGYFRSRGCLKGGSLALCRHFFPDGTEEGRHNDADHNFISKGSRDDAGNNFHEIVVVLDGILGLKNHAKI